MVDSPEENHGFNMDSFLDDVVESPSQSEGLAAGSEMGGGTTTPGTVGPRDPDPEGLGRLFSDDVSSLASDDSRDIWLQVNQTKPNHKFHHTGRLK